MVRYCFKYLLQILKTLNWFLYNVYQTIKKIVQCNIFVDNIPQVSILVSSYSVKIAVELIFLISLPEEVSITWRQKILQNN